MKMNEIGIGLLGFGTVGAGAVRGLQRNSEVIAERAGARLQVRRIADLDLDTDRGVSVDSSVLTTDADAVIADPEVDIVVELIGGATAARDLVLKALNSGKPVVTANKALLAEHGYEIFSAALENNTDIRFGASVGGGIPIVRALREGLVANRIESICGILNGTCNYILSRMADEGMTFDAALEEARKAGYAEAEPALDIDGHDTAHKVVVLASLAYGVNVPLDSVYTEGIRGISPLDISRAIQLGYRVKLAGIISRHPESIEARVHPVLIPAGHMLASVNGVFNAVMVRGDMTEDTLYYGRGAGSGPTASTVIGDIVDLARSLQTGAGTGFLPVAVPGPGNEMLPMGDVRTRYYLRLCLLDRPGVMAEITGILGEAGVGIASVVQDEGATGEYASVAVVTHCAVEKDLDKAQEKIAGLDIVESRPVRLRILGDCRS